MVKIAIADKHQFVHDGLSAMCLAPDSNFKLKFGVLCIEELEDKIFNEKIDVLIIDVNFPLEKGLALCKKVHEKFPALKILVFSNYSDDDIIAEVFRTGVHCYLDKIEGFQSLRFAINQLIQVGYYYRYNMAELLTSHPEKKVANINSVATFSKKEIEIAKLIQQELTSKEIAKKLNLHIKTVEFHKKNIRLKADCRKMNAAINYMIVHNILSQYT